MTGIIQTLVNGLLIGGMYALIASGLTITFGVLRIVNFANGELLMLSMYFVYTLYFLFNAAVSSYLLIIPVAVLMFAIGVIIMRVLLRPVIGKDMSSYILLTVGLSYFLQNLAQGIWSPNFLSINSPIKTNSFSIGGIVVPQTRFIAFIIALLSVLLVTLFLKKTDLGRAIRATSESRDIAQLLGVNPQKMFAIAMGIGVALVGVAGGLLVPIYTIHPRIGVTFSTIIFAVIVLGGLGNLPGALICGFLVGVVESFVGTYWSINLGPVVVFAMFIIVMLFKPTGLFGKGGVKL